MGSESLRLVGSGCRSLKLTVETFYQSIGDRVVGDHVVALDTKEPEVSEEFRLKLVSSFGGDG